MLTAAQLVVDVVANTGQAAEQLAAVGEEAEAVGVHANEATGGLGGMLHGMLSMAGGQLIFAGIAKAVAYLTDQIKDVFTQTNAWEDTQKQLNTVLSSTHGAAGVSASMALKLADSLSTVTRFSNSAVLATENLLLTFTAISKDQFPQATKVTLDMAQALGEDTKSAAIQLGKALQDPVLGVTALRRVGVNFSKSQVDVIKHLVATGQTAKAQQLILAELQREFGGSAEAAGKTFAGSLAILNNHLTMVKEQVGAAVIPVFTRLLTSLQPLFSGFVAAIPAVIAGVSAALAQLAAVGRALWSALQPGLQAVGKALGGLGKQAKTVDLHSLATAAQNLAKQVGTLAGDALKLLAQALSHIDLQKVVNGATLFLNILGGLVGFIASNKPVFIALAGAIGGVLVGAFVSWAIAATSAAVATLAATWPVLAIGAGIALLIAGIVELVQHWGDITAALGRFKDAVGDMLGGAGRALGAFFGSLGALIGKGLGLVGGLVQGYFGLWRTIIFGGFTLLKNIVQGAITDVLGIFRWLYDHNTYFHDMVVGIQVELSALRSLVTTIITDVRAFIVTKWLQIKADAMAAWLLFQQVVVKPVQDLLTQIEDILATIRTAIAAKWTALKTDATAAWTSLVSGVTHIASGLWDDVWAKGLKPLLDKLGTLASTFAQLGGSLIQQLLQGMLAGLKADGNIASNIGNTILGALGFHGVSLPHFAAGGTMAQSGWAVVGEHGPELVQLPGGAHVYPNGTGPVAGAGLGTAGSGAFGGQQTIILQLDSKTLAQSVVKQMPNVVRLGTGTRHL